jgi:hypothetical protein
MALFQRRVILQIEGQDLEGLKISFDVRRNLKNVPSSAEITVYNLNAETRRQISEAAKKKSVGARVVLLAGYLTETPHAVFIGRLRRLSHKTEGPNWVSRLSSGDGIPPSIRLGSSYGPGTNLGRVLEDVAGQLGVGKGNLGAFTSRLKDRSVGRSGLSVAGSGRLALSTILDQTGIEWSIQDDQIQLLDVGKARQTKGVLVSPETGLVGDPEALEKRRVRFTSLLQPGIAPGLIVELRSRELSGFYRVDSARYKGDSWQGPFEIECEGRPPVT